VKRGRIVGGIVWLAPLLLSVAGCGGTEDDGGPRQALIVVSPHPDDESISGGGTIHRIASDPDWYVHALYVSGGDRATVPGDCNGIPEDRKTEMIVQLRERETRDAWGVLAPTRDVLIDFLRGPDQGLVASSTIIDGIRQDVLSPEGTSVVERGLPIATQVPSSVRSALFLTAAIYDAHPDHRVAYRVARQAAEQLRRERHLEVRIWSWIVHDEASLVDLPICCAGDLHWPSPGPTNDYLALTDIPARPRPPMWNHVEPVGDLTAVRQNALAQHVSQLIGYPPLCMRVYNPAFYTRWTDKIEEPFYEEIIE